MRKLLSVFIFFFVCLGCYGQNGWIRQNTGITIRELASVCFVNENTGYVAGFPNIKTTNGGLNWTTIDTTALQLWGRSVYFINNATGFMGGYYGQIYKTTNGGLNWTSSTVQNNYINKIYFINEETGWAAIGLQFGGSIYKTTDTGNNWFSTFNSGAIGSIYFINPNIGYALGYYGNVFRSFNGGNNWVNWNQGALQSSDIQATDTNIVYISFRLGQVRKSIDGGLNWVNQQTGTTTNYTSLFFINSNTGWVVGGYGNPEQVIAATTNGGTNWNIQLNGMSPRLYDVYFINSYTGWAVGDSGVIFKTTNGGITSMKPENNNIPDKFYLYQNYPNPFNPKTKICFALPPSPSGEGHGVRLIVYNILGREAAILVNEQLRPGTYEVDWNAEDYPSGVYYYKFEAVTFFETKRMILIK